MKVKMDSRLRGMTGLGVPVVTGVRLGQISWGRCGRTRWRLTGPLLKTISFMLYNIPVGALQPLQENNEYRERVLHLELIMRWLPICTP
ncbi:hypothetical protein [Halopseudomonas pelagia]|uniref:hypothetical protein n=1 Tax=Halopseudomonas pelagia TaxID=553151 RepID=UPI001179A274|nr:hypothetical protein [Halopseudomonas pelagia]